MHSRQQDSDELVPPSPTGLTGLNSIDACIMGGLWGYAGIMLPPVVTGPHSVRPQHVGLVCESPLCWIHTLCVDGL